MGISLARREAVNRVRRTLGSVQEVGAWCRSGRCLGLDEAEVFGHLTHSATAGVLGFALLARASSCMSSSSDHRSSTVLSTRSRAARLCSLTTRSQSSQVIEITGPLA